MAMHVCNSKAFAIPILTASWFMLAMVLGNFPYHY